MKITVAASACIVLLAVSISHAADPAADAELLRAVNLEDPALVQAALAKGANPNQIAGDRPLLTQAAQNGKTEIVKALLAAKANADQTSPGFPDTPLIRAVENGHAETVQALLGAKANPNAKNESGETALVLATRGDKTETVRALVEAGADVTSIPEDGESLVLTVTQTNSAASPEIVRVLCKAKADVNLANAVATPLYYAADLGSVELVKALLECGADPNGKTPSGRVPLYAAVGNNEIVGLLLKAKADPNIAMQNASPILIAAIESGTDETVEALVKAGADVNARDDHGNSALKVAENYSKPAVVAVLKARGAAE